MSRLHVSFLQVNSLLSKQFIISLLSVYLNQFMYQNKYHCIEKFNFLIVKHEKNIIGHKLWLLFFSSRRRCPPELIHVLLACFILQDPQEGMTTREWSIAQTQVKSLRKPMRTLRLLTGIG